MSYILEALKKADAERGQVSASAAPPTNSSAPARALTREPSKTLWWIAGGILLLAGTAVLLSWKWLAPPSTSASPPAPAPLAERSEAPRLVPSVTDISAPSTASNLQPSPVPLPAPAAATGVASGFASTQGTAKRIEPILAKAPPPSPPKSASKSAPTSASTMAQTEIPTAVPAGKPAAVPAPALTATQRAALPSVQVSGSSYSANPDHRMLIVDGKVVKEGQLIAPDLTLESIGPRSAVFNQRGLRFNVNY